MSRYRFARVVLAGAAVIALAGCGASVSTSGAASGQHRVGQHRVGRVPFRDGR